MQSMRREGKRRVTIVTNQEAITANELPSFGSGSQPKYISPQSFNGAAASPNIPTFYPETNSLSVGKTTAAPEPLDFKKLQQAQRDTVTDHMAREAAFREKQSSEKIPEQEAILVKELRVETEIVEDANYNYERVYLPSQGILDPVSGSIFIRPLDTPEILDMHAVRINQNQTSLFDILNRCIKDFDIRNLSRGDFQHIFYWLRINSYTRNPFTVTWTSKYGNENKVTIQMVDLKITTLDISDEQITYYINKGFCVPTLRDGEEWSRYYKTIPEDQRAAAEYKSTYAQYMQGNTLAEKLERLKKMTPDDTVEILNFAKLFNFGVVEEINVRDKHFEPQAALTYLKNSLRAIDDLDLDSIKREDIKTMIMQQRNDIDAEITRIETEISNTGEAAATSETVTFNLSLDDFFPEIISATF